MMTMMMRSYTEAERDSWRTAIESASHAQVIHHHHHHHIHHHHHRHHNNDDDRHHHNHKIKHHHHHPDHDDDQMRQRLAQLEARLGQLRPEEPRPPSSPSDSIGEHLNVEEYFQK